MGAGARPVALLSRRRPVSSHRLVPLFGGDHAGDGFIRNHWITRADRVARGAVCGTVPGRAKAAEKYGVPQWFEDDDEILANGHIDAVTLSARRG
jgi:predicted dehydrogenase